MNSNNKVPNLSLVDITPRQRSPAKDFLLRLSPKRWSPESTPRLTPRSAPNSPKLSPKKAEQNLQKSISSPRKRRLLGSTRLCNGCKLDDCNSNSFMFCEKCFGDVKKDTYY